MLGQQAFVHIVVANSRGAKAFDECGKARVQRFHRMRIVVLVGEVGGMVGCTIATGASSRLSASIQPSAVK